MANYEEISGGGIDNPLGDGLVTRNELFTILEQIKSTTLYNQIEPLEVMDIFRDGGRVSQKGAIIGRYVFSEQGNEPEKMLEFLPLDSNIQQLPLVGEVYLGLSIKGQRYYFGRVSESPTIVNPTDFNISSESEMDSIETDDENYKVLNTDNFKNKIAYKQGIEFVNDSPSRVNRSEGETLIQGRFRNSIKLGNNLEPNSSNIKIVSGMKTNIEELQDDSSSIYLTEKEYVEYSEPTIENENLLSQDYNESQIIIDSDRIVFNAKKDDIGIFTNNNIYLKGDTTNINGSFLNVDTTDNIEIKSSTQTKIDSTKIDIGSESLVPAVLGNVDFIKVIDIILGMQISANQAEIGVQLARPVPNTIKIAELTEENIELNKIKSNKTYLSKKVNVE